MSASPSVRPYERTGATSYYSGMITPGDVHTWIEQPHSEEEWQARERVLIDQRRDADDGMKVDTRLLTIGFWTSIYAAVVAVLAFALVVPYPSGTGPLWAILTGIVAAIAALAGFVAVWMSCSDWRGGRVKQRIAERALREHHIGYAARG